MRNDYLEILSSKNIADLCDKTSGEIGTVGRHIEKDIYVCAVLDTLFGINKPRVQMWFKGGTSLTKCHGLIQRFSEDIDIVFDQAGLGFSGRKEFDHAAEISTKKRKKAYEELLAASEHYVGNELLCHVKSALDGIDVEVKVDEHESQTLLVRYKSVYGASDYFLPAVKIECGARSVVTPFDGKSVSPFVRQVIPGSKIETANIPTVSPVRTFWDKVLILHGLHCRHRDEGIVPSDKNRLSRHYYDLAMLSQSRIRDQALQRLDLLEDARSHNTISFPSSWRKYGEAVPGTLNLGVHSEVEKSMRTDYERMKTMIFGNAPEFSDIVRMINEFNEAVNSIPGDDYSRASAPPARPK